VFVNNGFKITANHPQIQHRMEHLERQARFPNQLLLAPREGTRPTCRSRAATRQYRESLQPGTTTGGASVVSPGFNLIDKNFSWNEFCFMMNCDRGAASEVCIAAEVGLIGDELLATR